MKHRKPVRPARVIAVAAPPEPVQGLEPSAELTVLSERLRKGQNQRGQRRSSVRVEGLDTVSSQQVQETLTRQEQTDPAMAVASQQMAFQARALADALGFEERKRQAGIVPKPWTEFQERAKASERAYQYQTPPRPSSGG